MAAPLDKPRGHNGVFGLLPAAMSVVIFILLARLVPQIAAGEVVRYAWDWVPSLRISLSFFIDGLSLTFGLLISGIGTLVFLYSNTYLAGHAQFSRFMLFLFAFMIAMLGLVLADNLITVFVFWELTTITSYLLIGFGHETNKGRRSALQALFVTGAGALALLAGFILLGLTAGSFELSVIVTQGALLKSHTLYVPILILILAGTFTKSAQFPFHFWLPNAMAAPTPVSAFLHSATMVKAGIYLMARLHPAMSGTEIWLWTLTIAGLFTAIFASLLALRQSDLKQSLAYTTLMALGTLTFLLGQNTAYALTAFATFLVVHSLYKAALFLAVGCIDHATGTREAEILGGLGRIMPVTAFASLLAALSMAGLPPLLGFIGKELIYAGTEVAQTSVILSAGAMVIANALMVAVAGIVAFRPFWQPAGGPLPRTPKKAPWPMVLGPLILALLGALLGLRPGVFQTALVDPMIAGFLGDPNKAKTLKLWAGVNLALILSVITLVLGFLLYLGHRTLRAKLGSVARFAEGFDTGWDKFINALKALAAWQTRKIQTGVLRHYIFVTFSTVAIGLGITIWWHGAFPGVPDSITFSVQNFTLIFLIVGGSLLTAFTRSRITAMAALGVVGIGVAIIFITYGAPDVAITQLLVETLVVVLVAVALLRLPYLRIRGAEGFRPWDALLSIATGAVVSVTLLAVLDTPLDRRLTQYFETTSWPEAFGRNIVNVILVDFRALDTFGEIAVVVIAALSAYALLRTTNEVDKT